MNIRDVDPNSISLAQSIQSYDLHYESEGELRETDTFYRWVLKTLGASSGNLLDIACGEGHLLKIANELGVKGVGIDFSKRAATLAAKIAPSSFVTICDGEKLPFDAASFDYATNMGSLEHFFDPSLGLREMRRILKPNGRAALILPNSYYWLDIVWHVWRRGFPVSHRQIVERFATAGQWRQLIEMNGFNVVAVQKYNLCFPKTLSDVRWYTNRPLQLVYPVLSPITPLNLSYSFLFVCSPC